MSDCKKDTAISILGLGGTIAKNIRLTNDRKTIELYSVDNLSVVCTMNIDSSTFLGIKIVSNELVYTDSISNLSGELNSPLSNNPLVSLGFSGGVLNIIGAEDISAGFTASQVNIRYDASTNSVIFEY